MHSIRTIRKPWMFPILCLIGGAVFLVTTNLRFYSHQNVDIPKYIRSKLNIFDSFEDVHLFNSQYISETTQTHFTNVGKGSQVSDNRKELLPGKFCAQSEQIVNNKLYLKMYILLECYTLIVLF